MAEISREDVIEKEHKVAKESKKVVDTHVFSIDYDGNDIYVEEMYADDTEIIEEILANYQYLVDYHEFIAKELEKLEKIEYELKSWYENAPSRTQEDDIRMLLRMVDLLGVEIE